MGLLSPILRNGTDGRLTWWCPGCDHAHMIQTGAGSGPRWGWNGNAEKPTFTPSVLVRTGRAVMPSKHGGWVLNMGGTHGTPGLCDASTVVWVQGTKDLVGGNLV